MEAIQGTLPLVDPNPHLRRLGPYCELIQDGDLISVFIGGTQVFCYGVGSKLDHRLAAATVANAKAAPIRVIVEAFGLDDATLWRIRQRLKTSGVAGLLGEKRGPKGPTKLIGPVVRRIVELHCEQALSQRAIAARLHLSPAAIRSALRSAGVLPTEEDGSGHQESLPFETKIVTEGQQQNGGELTVALPEGPATMLEEEAYGKATEESSLNADPQGLSTVQRAATPELAVVYAMLGLSPDEEAEVVFEPREGLPFGGVLLALPILAATGLFEGARRVYGSLRRGVYGLRATMHVLAALALLRRPRPEHLKGTDPAGLGDVLGLLRAPEVKTVRRKLSEIASVQKAHLLMDELARKWLAEVKDGDGLGGTLYIDGHVRDYHGKQELPKTHISQRNRSAPATTDYWINGIDGDPVFVVNAKANAAMTRTLLGVVKQVEELSGGRKGTIVFDRGGWSHDLFVRIRELGWHFLTYRKGKIRKHPRKSFLERSMVIDGKERRYMLSERNVRLRDDLKLREIAESREDGGQTVILTSHFDKPAVLLAYRMFQRWRQENYFRYMKENFALDALVDYSIEADDPTREVPNPARKRMDKKVAAARAEVAKLEREYGAAVTANVEAQRPTMRGFKIANSDTGQALLAAKATVEELILLRSRLPKRVAVADAIGSEDVVKLSTERKLFTDAIKAACYRAETALLRLLEPHFLRAEEEGRAFLKTVMQQQVDLLVNGSDVTVRFAPMSAPRFTAALAGLCEAINRGSPIFPESAYRLHYEVAEAAR